MDKGWAEINHGADLRIPRVYRFIIKYVTPVILLGVFLGSLPAIYEKLTLPANPYVVGARFLLLALYLGIAYAVYLAYQKRRKATIR
jgi:hypothetical protein